MPLTFNFFSFPFMKKLWGERYKPSYISYADSKGCIKALYLIAQCLLQKDSSAVYQS